MDFQRFRVLPGLYEEVISNLLTSTWVVMEGGNGCLGLISEVLSFAIDQC